MSHEIRRRDRALGTEEAYAILAKGDHGVLATWGEDGYPYAVPLNHVLDGEVLYLHCAQEGHKLENIQHCDKVSYCVVTESEVLPMELSTQYESAVAFGLARRVEDPDEKYRALVALLQRFAPEHMTEGMEALRKSFQRTAVLRIDLERVTGKARKKAATGE